MTIVIKTVMIMVMAMATTTLLICCSLTQNERVWHLISIEKDNDDRSLRVKIV